jgi:hypothetical protein
MNIELMLMVNPAENQLSFIETSALDASNVESAFQTILTGTFTFANTISIEIELFRRYLQDRVLQIP